MKIVSVGCSFTTATGVLRENNYTSQLAKLIKYKVSNYGAAGHSNQYIFRKTIELLKNWNNDDILLIQWTNPIRDEIITKEGFLFEPPAIDWVSLEWLYGPNPMDGLQKIGITNKDEFDAKILEKYKNKVIDYSIDFYRKDYQLHLSFCFQLSLHALLEKMGVKYIMFFGWEFENVYENQKEIFNFVNNKFLKETFGSYTNTIGNEHPDTEAHLIWANYLHSKIIEFNYITYTKNII